MCVRSVSGASNVWLTTVSKSFNGLYLCVLTALINRVVSFEVCFININTVLASFCVDHRRRHGGGVGQRGQLAPNLRSGNPVIDADPRFRGRENGDRLIAL